MKNLILNPDYNDVSETDEERAENMRNKENLNQAYHRILSGPSTLHTDNRKEVKVKAKPAKTVVKAFPVAALKAQI